MLIMSIYNAVDDFTRFNFSKDFWITTFSSAFIVMFFDQLVFTQPSTAGAIALTVACVGLLHSVKEMVLTVYDYFTV